MTPPVYPFNTPPCVHSKRPRVYRHHAHMCFNMCAWCRHTRRRFECTHGSVLNLHTVFSACHTTWHTPRHTTTHHDTPRHTTTHHDTPRHTTTHHHTPPHTLHKHIQPHTTTHTTSHGDRDRDRRQRKKTEKEDRERRQREKRRRKRR